MRTTLSTIGARCPHTLYRVWRVLMDYAPLCGLVVVNAPLVYWYLGLVPTIVYVLCVAALAAAITLRRLSLPLLHRLALVCVVVSLGAQLAGLWVLAPQWDGRMDRNEALTYWLSALGRGEYPYAVPTNRGNPISVLPFMHIVALPFVALGNVGYLEIASYVVLVALLWHRYREAPRKRYLAIIVLSSAPLVFFEVVGISDIIANMTLVMCVIAFVSLIEKRGQSPTHRDAALLGSLMGAVAATRFALAPVLAVPALYLVTRWNRRALLAVFGLAAVVFLSLVLPFLVWDPVTFVTWAPFGVNNRKLGSDVLVQAGWLVLSGLTVLLSGLWAKKAEGLYGWLVPVLAVIVLGTWTAFYLDLTYLQMVFIPLLFAL